MTVEFVRAFLGWGAILNMAMVTVWFALFVCAHDLMFTLHRRWFTISREAFDTLHYALIAAYKVGIWLFFIVPYFAVRLAG